MENELEIIDGSPIIIKRGLRSKVDLLKKGQHIIEDCGKGNKKLRYARSMVSEIFHADTECKKRFRVITEGQTKGSFAIWRTE